MSKSSTVPDSFEAVIGLEVHCQLLTASKAFSPESAEFGRSPNTQIDLVSLGYPGTLPVLNERVVQYAVRLGLATNCSIRLRSTLSRKHYFYPDLPKGYQISQYEDPICFDGSLMVTDAVSGLQRSIAIKRIHIEEDAGKSVHDRDDKDTHLDFNRCGVALLELVTEPDIRHPSEAYEFVKSIRQIVRYLGICDGNMEEGSLRCDANVSVRRPDEQNLRTKTEIKNVNSLRHVEQALAFEIARQQSVYSEGGQVEQETLLWDPDAGRTRVMRTKEMAHDYRYFADPDLPPVELTKARVDSIRDDLPELPFKRRNRFETAFSLSSYDATLLTEERAVADYFEAVVNAIDHPSIEEAAKASANFVLTNVLRYATTSGNSDGLVPVSAERLADLLAMRLRGELSSSAAAELFDRLLEQDGEVLTLAHEMNLLQVSDMSSLEPLVDGVLDEHPSQVDQYLGGKEGLIGFLIGQVMKASSGAADPTVVREMLASKLEARRPAG